MPSALVPEISPRYSPRPGVPGMACPAGSALVGARCGHGCQAGVGVLHPFHLRQHRGHVVAERDHRLAFQRFRRRHGHLERVAVHAVDAEFVVQVRAGGPAGTADIADHRALLEPGAGLVLAEARHVRIEGGVALAVVEHHGAAIAALPADERHARVAGGHDRGAVASAVVHALVGAGAAQDRVLARAAEAGGDPRIRDRHADEGLLQRAAVGVVVTHGAVALEAEAGVGLAAGGDARGMDRAAADALALAPGLVVDDAEASAL